MLKNIKSDYIVITKSLKDVMCLYEYGIPSIAPCSENEFLSEAQYNRIKNKFKHVILLYDNTTIYLDRKYSKWDDFCRSNVKMLEGLRGEFGEDWDVNTEVTKYLNYKKYCNA